MAGSFDLWIGKRLGADDEIRVQRLIGRGASGAIYLGYDERERRSVALKCLSPEYARNETSVQRFLREGVEFARLRHPNLVAVYGWGAKDGRLYLVSEYVDGVNLFQLLQDEGPQAPEEGLRIARGVAAGLSAAHRAGVVHRDLKPENVMMRSADRHVLILDFGIAKDLKAAMDLTSTGMYIGTPAYSAPEQIRGDPVDHRADVFALGVILYELLTGKVAFEGRHSTEVLRATLREEPAPIENVNRAVSLPIARLVNGMIRKDPVERFADMEEVMIEIDSILDAVAGELSPDDTRSIRMVLKKWFE